MSEHQPRIDPQAVEDEWRPMPNTVNDSLSIPTMKLRDAANYLAQKTRPCSQIYLITVFIALKTATLKLQNIEDKKYEPLLHQ